MVRAILASGAMLAAAVVTLGTGPARAQSADALGAFNSRAELEAFVAAHRPLPPEEMEIVVAEPGPRGPIPDLPSGEVDEAGEVGLIGDHLVILRRGRLHTVSAAGNGLRAVDSVVVAPTEAQGYRFDRMLVFRDQVIVFGEAEVDIGGMFTGATSITRFRLTAEGRLERRDVTHLALDGALSPHLIGGRLVFYGEVFDEGWGPAPALPAQRTWSEGAPDAAFETILDPRDAFIRTSLRRRGGRTISHHLALAFCDLTTPALRCRSSLILSNGGTGWPDLSSEAAYLWTGGDGDNPPTLYRVPLDGEPPRAVGVRGYQGDDLRIDERRGEVRTLVYSRGDEDEDWDPRFGEDGVALLTLPLSRFGSGSGEALKRDYRFLPPFPGEGRRFIRLIGDHVLYSANGNDGGWDREPGRMVVTDRDGGAKTFDFDGPIVRIDALGDEALVVSGWGAATFTTLSLGREPAVVDRFTAPADTSVEAWTLIQRAPDRSRPALFGVAVARDLDPDEAGEDLVADLLLVSGDDRGRLSAVGELSSRRDLPRGPDCDEWCDGWFANSRAIFLGDRVFALLGYELVEGRVRNGGVREVRRIDFTPPGTPAED